MNPLQIKPSDQYYIVTINDKEYLVPKNETNTLLLTLLCCYMDEANIKKEMFLPNLILQYRNSIRLAILLKAWLLYFSTHETNEYTKELEEMYQLALGWNFFLQDVFKKMDIDLPRYDGEQG